MSRRFAFMLLVVVVALALLASACGGGDESSNEATPAAEWADGVCTAISSYEDDLTQIGDQLQDPSSLSQERLEEAANDARAATDALVEELRSLGRPETESGEEARQAVDDLATTVEDEFAEIEKEVDELSGITGLPSAITAISASLASIGTALSTTIPTIEDVDARGDLREAFEQAPSCDELRSSSQ
jgi:chromosome segregation ATPase